MKKVIYALAVVLAITGILTFRHYIFPALAWLFL